MGVQAIRAIAGKKSSTVITTPLTAAAVFPAANECSIVTMLGAGDVHRIGEVQRRVRDCINYARDYDLFTSATSIAVVVKLDEAKAAIRTETLVANIVTGDVGIAIVGSERAKGSRNILENAHRQVLDWMNEQDRLAV
jgi:hypothetical protein